jgi:hypothetical protein
VVRILSSTAVMMKRRKNPSLVQKTRFERTQPDSSQTSSFNQITKN